MQLRDVSWVFGRGFSVQGCAVPPQDSSYGALVMCLPGYCGPRQAYVASVVSHGSLANSPAYPFAKGGQLLSEAPVPRERATQGVTGFHQGFSKGPTFNRLAPMFFFPLNTH